MSILGEKEKQLHLEHADRVIDDSSDSDVPHYNDADDKRIVRKIDWHLLPFVSLLYLLSFLDRSNIGNARIAGLSTDLHLKGLEYNICVAVFFVTYSAAEIPSNIALKIFRPSRWIPTIMLTWGIVMTLMGLVKNFRGLLIARLFLGLTEAGLFPGVNFYLTLWYRRGEIALRIAIFFSAATVAGAFGGLLAAGLVQMDGIADLNGWAWLFIIEGIATVLVSLVAYWYMYDYPATATFLTEPERRHVVERLKRDHPGLATHMDKKFIWQAFTDYKSWLLVTMYTGILIPLYAFSLFLPTIIKELGYSSTKAQLLSVPPYVCGCIATLAAGYYSDKLYLRGPFIVGFSTLAMAGYAMVIGVSNKPGASYVGTILAAVGVFPMIPCSLSWVSSNVGGELKRGVVIALVIGIGNLGGVCSSFIYLSKDAPRYFLGHGVVLGSLGVVFFSTLFMIWDFSRINRNKDEQCAREGITQERAHEFRDMGDASPLFRYAI